MTLVTNGQLLPVASLNYSAEQRSPCQFNISLHATKTQDHEDLHSAASLKMQIQSLFIKWLRLYLIGMSRVIGTV